LVIVFLVAIHFANGFQNPLRLIEFNETTRLWLTPKQIDALANECGATHENAIHHGGFMDITDHRNLSPSGLSEQVKARLTASPFPPAPTHQTTVASFIKLLDVNKLREYNNKLSSFHTRYYTTETGKQAAEWIKSEFEANKGGRSDITVNLFPHSWLQSSVVARIPGNGPHADEVVIVGAHEDSVNGGGTQRSPGADDDASGTSTVLELFRVIVASGFVPDRTIEFHTYSAEEVGLRGSQDIAAAYQRTSVPVYAQMQLDMTFYVKPGTVASFGIITDWVSPDLTDFLRKLVTAYSTLKAVESKCGYGCSDHASWYKSGYASCFPFESSFSNLNNKIHTNQDLIEFLNVEHGLEFAKVATGFIVELGLAN